MHLQSEHMRLSASDLASYLGCHHLTNLDIAVAQGKLKPPAILQGELDDLEALWEKGLRHEAAYVEYLRGDDELQIVSFRDDTGAGGSAAETARAMRSGADIIVQASLEKGRWVGVADILRKVDMPSRLGDWSYEVIDTKLSRNTRAGTILQLCLYSEIVTDIQGVLPERMGVVSPSDKEDAPFKEEWFRIADYGAYYRLVKAQMEQAVEHTLAGTNDETYPEPVPQCDTCRWMLACDRRRRQDDHLSLVAGLAVRQQKEVRSWGIPTLEAFGDEPTPLRHRPERGAIETYENARNQAHVQLEGRRRQTPYYELRPLRPEGGLSRLPTPSPGDIFFDIEGDPFAGTHGFEYLFGWATLDPNGEPRYSSQWALDAGKAPSFAEGERAIFEAFVDTVMARWEEHPDLHIYHFAPYEPSALKRLMGRYATREDEVDRMLRAELFVDLLAATRQSLWASVERYSIKDLEQFYGYTREVELRQANVNRHALELLLENGQQEDVTEEMRRIVERYNRDDCISTIRLRDWLEDIRTGLVERGEVIQRPAPKEAEPEQVSEHQGRINTVMERLLHDVPPEHDVRSDEQQARWLLAHLLDWHRREDKSTWWEFFRMADLDEEQLLNERTGIGGFRFVEALPLEGKAQTPTHRYSFARQETTISRGNDLYTPNGDRFGSVAAIDMVRQTIDVKKTRGTVDAHPSAAFAFDRPIPANAQKESLLQLGEWVADHGMDAPGERRAARDLLLARPPRLAPPAQSAAPLRHAGEPELAAARRIATQLDGGVLAIQGPPGSGKTYTGARMICDLARAGKKVGVTANSHAVIRNLLNAVVDAAEEEGVDVRCIQRVGSSPTDGGNAPIVETSDNAAVLSALQDGRAQVGAGTAWVWSRQEFAEAVDVLFIDEAGQMSLANALAVAPAARNLVLLGDPQQLEQPQQGSHPEGADASVLEHVLQGSRTIPDHQGLFLEETWRLHPSICNFTSELFYEDRLRSRGGLDAQSLAGTGSIDGAGLWIVPVEHEGNTSASTEEADCVADLYRTLLSDGVSWTDRAGTSRPLSKEDVLIVVPYNLHLAEIVRRLGGDARVGTVDKFQGQEAPVVIYSMATSSPEDAPRGMEFLFSLNRLNVATSRAQCASILVASPRLFEPECRTPRQMQLANALCRYREMARYEGQ